MAAFVTFLYGEISYKNTFKCSKIKFTLLMIMNVNIGAHPKKKKSLRDFRIKIIF